MGRDIVDIALVSITTVSQGSKTLEQVVSLNVGKRDPKTPVKTMNPRRRAIGFTRGVPDFDADLEVVLLPTNNEIDWDALQASGEYFTLHYQRNTGDKFACIDCQVGDISDPYRESGETRESVKLHFLDHKGEQ